MTAREMVDSLRATLAQNAGVKSVTTDGQTIQFDRVQALAELDYWERKLAKQTGKRNTFRGIDVGSAWGM